MEPLARKYRPQKFSEIVGQHVAVKMLQHLLESQKIHPAILLHGMRGVGKTTLARLFAKSISCIHGLQSEPCGACVHCLAIQRGEHVDVVEIDAASNTKVESIRDLLENLPYAPSLGRFRIYILDEAHMLSRHSFNALLKILEEPPTHVQFIFATTEPEKIPETVRSRLFAVRLYAVSNEELAAHFKSVLEEETVGYDPQSLHFLAQAAQGSVRDGLTLVDQLIAQGQGKILLEHAKNLSEKSYEQQSLLWLRALHEHHFMWLVEHWAKLEADAVAIDQLLCALMRWIEKICLIQGTLRYHPSLALQADQASDEFKLLWPSFVVRPEKEWMRGYHLLLAARKEVAFAPSPLLNFEMACLRLLHYWPNCSAKTPTPGGDSSNQDHCPPSEGAPSSDSHHSAAVTSNEDCSCEKIEKNFPDPAQKNVLEFPNPSKSKQALKEEIRVQPTASELTSQEELSNVTPLDGMLNAYQRLSADQSKSLNRQKSRHTPMPALNSTHQMTAPSIEFFEKSPLAQKFFQEHERYIMRLPLGARWRNLFWQGAFVVQEQTSEHCKILFTVPSGVLLPALGQFENIGALLTTFCKNHFNLSIAFKQVDDLDEQTLLEKFLNIQTTQKQQLQKEIEHSEISNLLVEHFKAQIKELRPNVDLFLSKDNSRDT